MKCVIGSSCSEVGDEPAVTKSQHKTESNAMVFSYWIRQEFLCQKLKTLVQLFV